MTIMFHPTRRCFWAITSERENLTQRFQLFWGPEAGTVFSSKTPWLWDNTNHLRSRASRIRNQQKLGYQFVEDLELANRLHIKIEKHLMWQALAR